MYRYDENINSRNNYFFLILNALTAPVRLVKLSNRVDENDDRDLLVLSTKIRDQAEISPYKTFQFQGIN
jgi:hypothetical protein